MEHIDSYYSRTATPGSGYPALSGVAEADVCVIGGGMAGLTTALELLRCGKSVVLVEANRIAWGASGRNGGFVGIGFARDFSSIEARVGPEAAGELFRLSVEGLGIVAGNIERLAMADAQPVPGIVWSARYEAGDAYRRYRDMLASRFDYEIELLEAEHLRDLMVTDAYHQGLLDRRSFHFHPLNYANGLAREITRLGGKVFEGSAVSAVVRHGAGWRVSTGAGQVNAATVAVTCGGYTGRFMPKLHRAYQPIATYVLLTEAAPDLIATAIRTRYALGDDRRASDYYRLVDDGQRILWGGKITTRTAEPRDLAGYLRASMVATYPQLAELKVETAWTGLMAYARHLMPQVGQSEPGLWHATAFGGHGMNTTAISGRLLAEGICGESRRYQAFEPFGLSWNGGWLGKAAVQLTYWQYQLQDYLNERRSR